MKRAFILSFLLILASACFAQKESKLDSLKRVLPNAKTDTGRFSILTRICRMTMSLNPGKAKDYIPECEALANKINTPEVKGRAEVLWGAYYDNVQDPEKAIVHLQTALHFLTGTKENKALADCLNLMGKVKMATGGYIEALGYLKQSDSLAVLINNARLHCENLTTLGRLYADMENDPKAFKLLQEALAIADQYNLDRSRAQISLTLGSLYSEGPNKDLANKYLNISLAEALKRGDTTLLVNVYTLLGNNYYYAEQYENALKIYQQVEAIAERNKNKRALAGALGNMGNVYADMGDIPKSIDYQTRALTLFDQVSDKEGMAICFEGMAESYYGAKDYDKALQYFNSALKLGKEMYSLADMIESYNGLAKTYEAKGDFQKAHQNLKWYKSLSDSIFLEAKTKGLTEMELNYQFQAKQREQDLIDKQKELEDAAEARDQRRINIGAAIGIVMLLIILAMIYRGSRQRKKAHEQLKVFNAEMLEQKEVIEQKNKEITDSIHYAKRIQESILPERYTLKKQLPDSFILYMPKDIVSGDFYWFTEKDENLYLAAVDCTGHGVPGALMSMVGNEKLFEAVNEQYLRDAGEILHSLDKSVISVLKQSTEQGSGRDGMDIALVAIDKKNRKLHYAAANRPLWIVSSTKGLSEIKASKFPIGGGSETAKVFVKHTIDLEEDCSYYIFTDGYADQFGGIKSKKMTTTHFKKLLIEINSMSMADQEKQLKEVFETWRGDNEQVDDVLVIGFKI